jgi:hypothetical protein
MTAYDMGYFAGTLATFAAVIVGVAWLIRKLMARRP